MDHTDIDFLMEVAAPLLAELLVHEDLSTFRQALHHQLNQQVPFDSPLRDAGFQGALATTLYECMPLPHRDFKPGQLTKPKRNEPCPCGSGKKYKQCCANLGEPPRLPADELFNLAVPFLNQKAWKKLADHAALPRSMRLSMMFVGLSEGKPKKAWQLVSPVFDGLHDATEADGDLLSLGLEVLRELNYSAKRQKYMVALTELSGVKPLQALGHQRLAMYSADAGVLDSAEYHLGQARRLAPEHSDLPLVELNVMRVTAGDEEIRNRARVWQKRIDKLWGDAYPHRDFIDDLAENGVEAFYALEEEAWALEASEIPDDAYATGESAEDLAADVENALLSGMGLLIEGVAHSQGQYHLGTESSQAVLLEQWRSTWMDGAASRQRPGDAAEYEQKWMHQQPEWLTLLEANPQLSAHTTVLLELFEWVRYAPDEAELAAIDLEQVLKMQRLSVLNQLVQGCLDTGIQLSSGPVQNMPFLLHASRQLADLIDDNCISAAQSLARRLNTVVEDALTSIPEVGELTLFDDY